MIYYVIQCYTDTYSPGRCMNAKKPANKANICTVVIKVTLFPKGFIGFTYIHVITE